MNSKKLSVFLIIFFVFLGSLTTVSAVIREDSMQIFAVTNNGGALAANLILKIENGNGKVWSSLSSLIGTTTQSAERTSIQVAEKYVGDVSKYDYKFDINSPASLVEGPSAGAAMTLLVISMLRNQKIPSNVGITGTITKDGYIGAVGGIFHKTKKAAELNYDLFMIPKGEARQIVEIEGKIQTINLPEYALKTWGLKVIEVDSIDDVIKYAYSDIENINVNNEKNNSVETFTPEAANYKEQLEPIKKLNEKYIQETKEIIKEAKSALEGTMIEDQTIIDHLLGRLNAAQESVSEAELLFANNYFYSSANFAFLAKVHAETVKAIAENPSLLSKNSTALDLKIEKLDEGLNSFETELNANLPVEYLEWFISAKQRFIYSRLNVDEIMSTKSIIVGGETEETTMTKYGLAIKKVEDYAFAKSWYEISKDFYSISKNSKSKVEVGNIFSESIKDFIVKTEDGLSVLSEEEHEDVLRRLNSAKYTEKKNWNLTSLYDGASSLALVNSKITIKNLEDGSFSEVEEFLDNKIKEIENNINNSKYKYVWPVLYLDHAKFFYKTAMHYKERGEIISARRQLESGISLAFLAENLFIVTKETQTYIQKIKDTKIIVTETSKDTGNGKKTNEYNATKDVLKNPLFIFLVITGVAFGLVLMYIGVKKIGQPKQQSFSNFLQSEMKKNNELQRKLDLNFALNRIPEGEYTRLKEEYSQKLTFLESEKGKITHDLLKLDKQRAQLLAINHLIHDLRNHYKEGLVSEGEYKRMLDEYRKNGEELMKSIQKNNIKTIKLTKKKIKIGKFPVKKEVKKKAPETKKEPKKEVKRKFLKKNAKKQNKPKKGK